MHSEEWSIIGYVSKYAMLEHVFAPWSTGRKQNNFGGKNASQGMANQNHICVIVLMGLQPVAEVISSIRDILARLVARINFGVHDMRISQAHRQKIVHMGWEAFEASLCTHEAMQVNE